MRTYPLFNSNGEVYAFEIPNSYFPSSGAVARYFGKCPDAVITRTRKLFEIGKEVHVEFVIGDVQFVVWEPFGDNSRYWIGPKGEAPVRTPEIDSIISYVSNTWPGPISQFSEKVLMYFGIRA